MSEDDGQEDEDKLWQEAVKGVRTLDHERLVRVVKTSECSLKGRAVKIPRVKDTQNFDVPLLDSGALNPGLDRGTEQRFRKGKLPIEATLDLHGLTQLQAYDALKAFVYKAYVSEYRCVLVITGKGGGAMRDPLSSSVGVLRSKVPEWLLEVEFSACVHRISPARPQHGGDGALYVLLRRKK